MRIAYAGLIAFFLAFATACSPPKKEAVSDETTQTLDEKSLEEMRAESLAKIDKEACKAKGGEIHPEGMLGLWRCVVKYYDAGAICSDQKDCQGRCLVADDITVPDAPAGEAKGRCEADDSPFGCHAEIKDGVIQQTICVD